MSQALAQITPAQRMVASSSAVRAPRNLTNREKAAVIVRLMLAEGSALPLGKLPDHMQAALTEQMGRMQRIDRATLVAVMQEFTAELDQLGLSFPGGLEGALSMMDGHISAPAANRLRRMAGATSGSDPWERLTTLPAERLLPVMEEESTEIAAVMLSKLPVAKAAELLGKLPGDKARRVAYAVSMTGNVDPDTVRRIGQSLAAQLDNQPPKAFDAGPVERVGAILNISPAATRDEVLKGLEEADADFAEQVRRAIFTFLHIPVRVQPRDVPKVVRMVEQPALVTALIGAQATAEGQVAAEFILANMSQRMAQGLREEMTIRGKVKDREAEDAMNAVIAVIRQLETAGELVLQLDDEE